MMSIPVKVSRRLSEGLKYFQPILSSAKSRDANESDTSMIVTDILSEMFGYDKYSELTRELSIRGTFCDLATKIDGKYQMLIEVKAIGIDLKDSHIKQAVDYGSNKGIEWVALTNGYIWKVFKIIFSKPLDFELIFDVDILSLNYKKESDLENIFLLTRESMLKSGLYAYDIQKQATNKFNLAAIILSDTIIEVIRRELRRISPEVKVQREDLKNIIMQDVLKREVIECEKAEIAKKKVQKANKKIASSKKENVIPDISTELSKTPFSNEISNENKKI